MLVLTFRNISEMAPVSDYEYEVWVTRTDGSKHVIKSGLITKHKRADGWEKLVRRVLAKRIT